MPDDKNSPDVETTGSISINSTKHIIWPYALAIVIILIIILLFINLSMQPGMTFSEPILSSVNKTIVVQESIPISNEKYTKITDHKYSEDVNLSGYLSQEIIKFDDSTSRVTKYLVDDSGNKIKISFGVSTAIKYYSLFPENGITNKTYNVSGKYLYENYGFTIYAQNIVESEHVTIQKSLIIVDNTTSYINRTVKSKLNFSHGLMKLINYN